MKEKAAKQQKWFPQGDGSSEEGKKLFLRRERKFSMFCYFLSLCENIFK
jgi:hypothetical protein